MTRLKEFFTLLAQLFVLYIWALCCGDIMPPDVYRPANCERYLRIETPLDDLMSDREMYA